MTALTNKVSKKNEQSAHALSRYENLDEVQSRQDQDTMVDKLYNRPLITASEQHIQGIVKPKINNDVRSSLQSKAEGSAPISSRMASDRSQIEFSENSEQDAGRAFKFYWKNWVQKTIGHSRSPMEIESNRRANILSELAKSPQAYGFLPKVSSQKQLSLLKHPKAAIINKNSSSNNSGKLIMI